MIEIRTMQGTPLERTRKIPLNNLNNNTLIVGSSGTGKSSLMRELEQSLNPKLKLIFKADGERALNIARNRPFIAADKKNFADAWKTTTDASAIGYMLIQEQIIIEQTRKEGQTLNQLKTELRKRQKETERINAPVYELILNRLEHLYPTYSGELRAEGKLSMEELTEEEYLFFSDYILRTAYEQLQQEIISIDEIHRLSPLLNTTIGRLAREIRSRGAILATTQSLSDLPSALINNFATIFCFQTLDSRDLQLFQLIDKELAADILKLDTHEFLELRSYARKKTEGLLSKMELIL